MGQINKYASTACPLFGQGNLTTDGDIERFDMFGQLFVGADTAGHDVKFFGATTGKYWLWDESVDKMIVYGGVEVGVDDTGHDVKFFGATAGSYMLWDESDDRFEVVVAASATGKGGIFVNNTFTLATAGVHKGVQSDVTYTPATSGFATPIGIAGKAVLNGNFTGGAGYLWGVQGQLQFNDAAVVNDASSIFAGVRAVVTASATPTFTACDTICGLYVDILSAYDLSAASGVAAIAYFAHQGGGAGSRGTMDTVFRVQAPNTTNFIDFDDSTAGGSVLGPITVGGSAGTLSHKILCTVDGTDAYIYMYAT